MTDAAGEVKGYLLLRKRIPKTHLLRLAEAGNAAFRSCASASSSSARSR